jgi:hypothetical protein
MRTKPIYMGTTGISTEKTVGQIIGELVRSGASSVNTDYRSGRVSGLRWVMNIGSHDVLFNMPVRIEPVFKMLESKAKRPRADFRENAMRDAERIAWRQLLRWVQAQNAMIEAGMATAGEVYLPYRLNAAGKTLFEYLSETNFRAIEAPTSKH